MADAVEGTPNSIGSGEEQPPAGGEAAAGVTLEQVMAQVKTLQESNQKLETNNAKLRTELVGVKDKVRAYGDDEPDEIRRKARAYEEAQLAEEEAKVGAVETAKRAKDQILALENRITQMNSDHKAATRKLVVDRDLVDALAGVIFDDTGREAAYKLLYDRIIVDPDSNKPMVGGLDLKDYVHQWITTDRQGLYFAEGDGAAGSGQRGRRQTVVPSDERERWFDPGDPPGTNPHYNETRQAEVYLSDRALYNGWKAKYQDKGQPMGMGPTVMAQ